MRDELLKAEDANVIVVDWAGGSLPLYTQATANTRLVGLELAYFIKHLMVSTSNKSTTDFFSFSETASTALVYNCSDLSSIGDNLSREPIPLTVALI